MGDMDKDIDSLDDEMARAALNVQIKHFLVALENAEKRRCWPGLRPSLRYMSSDSRAGYLTAVCQEDGFARLVYYVSKLVCITAISVAEILTILLAHVQRRRELRQPCGPSDFPGLGMGSWRPPKLISLSLWSRGLPGTRHVMG